MRIVVGLVYTFVDEMLLRWNDREGWWVKEDHCGGMMSEEQ